MNTYVKLKTWQIDGARESGGSHGILIMLALAHYQFRSRKKSAFTASLGQLTEYTGLSRPTVIKTLANLEYSGLILVNKQHKKTTIYSLTRPPEKEVDQVDKRRQLQRKMTLKQRQNLKARIAEIGYEAAWSEVG